jgi:4,5-dihydroxyphthalate decarboxylase
MVKDRLDVSIALSANARTQPLIDGTIQAEGLRFIPTVVHPSEMFWRQLHFGDFDISEMSLSSLLIAVAKGNRTWVAIPVYTMRRFFQTMILVRRGSGIEQPSDLIGRRVGVPEYQQTSAIWSRGILEDYHGVSPRDVEWFMERGPDRSHGSATGFVAPPGIRLSQIPPDKDIGGMLASSELDATLLYINDRNLVDRSRLDISEFAEPLFRDAVAESQRYYGETGLYPINHAVVVRRSLAEQHPWIVLNLFKAFEAARVQAQLTASAWLQPFVETGRLAMPAMTIADDPMPYGFGKSRRELEILTGYVHRQGLTERRLALDDIFAPSTLEL